MVKSTRIAFRVSAAGLDPSTGAPGRITLGIADTPEGVKAIIAEKAVTPWGYAHPALRVERVSVDAWGGVAVLPG